MAMRGGPRLAVGSEAWVARERSDVQQLYTDHAEEFSFAVRNEFEWLNEHMAEALSENSTTIAELFKTPGKLRGKTPRTTKKTNAGEARVPLSNIFSATPKGAPNPFANIPNINLVPKTKIMIAEDAPDVPAPKAASPTKTVAPQQQQQKPLPVPVPVADSGYHGSQSLDTLDVDMVTVNELFKRPETAMDTIAAQDFASSPTRTTAAQFAQASPTRASIEETFQSAKEDQTRWVTANMTVKPAQQLPEVEALMPSATPQQSPKRKPGPVQSSPVKSWTPQTSPVKAASSTKIPMPTPAPVEPVDEQPGEVDATAEDLRSPSDGSSPIRPIVRKSSLNFASLPAREPLTTKKSLGPRISRISQLEQTRTSYYHRQTGGRSIGANTGMDVDDENDDNEDDNVDDMDVDDDDQVVKKAQVDAKVAIAAHNKTYTQRLQDQISMLGKSQPSGPRPSKSLANLLPAQQPLPTHQAQQPQPQPAPEPKAQSPAKQQKLSVPAPGAFPEDDDDDWIAPPPTAQPATRMASPRPELTKCHTADVMEGLHGKDTIGGSAFVLPKSRPTSPKKAPGVPERTTSAYGHSKSASVPSLPIMENTSTPKKTISVSNPTLGPVAENSAYDSPPKSPSRSLRESPLKHVKNKLSSILKTSKGLLASSAALSAEGKASLMSPSTTRLGMHAGPSTDSLRSMKTNEQPLYPELPQRVVTPPIAVSPVRNATRKTRASVEREKKEQKEKEKESKGKEKERKDAQRLVEQMEKLEKEREKEREKARLFNEQQEKFAAMERKISEAKKQQKAPQAEIATPAPPRSPTKATRSSPRKTKAQKEAEEKAAAAAAAREAADDDMDMLDAAPPMAPPSILRPTTTPGNSRGQQALRRPTRPTQEVASKAKAAPTLIRVKPTSAQQAQFHPSNSLLGATLQDTLGQQPQEPRRQLNSKPSHASLHQKPSMQSLKSSVGSSGRPKALELAAKRKEAEEREAQRKKEAKHEMERKRAAMQEEERRKEQLRKAEMERQIEEERRIAEKAAQAKKEAQRQAAIERAKQTRAPPPAPRQQPIGQSEYNMTDKGPSRPPSRLGSMIPQDSSRPVNASLNASKMAPKRTLQPEANEMQRNGPSYQAKEAKRMRMSEEFDEDIDMADSQRSVIRGPPVRPSGGFKKELHSKSQFTSGYTTAPQGVSRDLFKQTMTSSHNTITAKPTHPLDTAQFSKGQIPFAPNPNPPAPSTAHKTPARQALLASTQQYTAAKSVSRSSPFGKQGDNISLPDIQTDDEDDDSDASPANGNNKLPVASWTNSPDLRRILAGQETIDPMQIFGPPQAINMEEIFTNSKNKAGDRYHKFRARTSSANWSGEDRLTAEEVRKDLQARERMRREGGWSYELARDGLA
ncbi:hypothetical protein GE09DRAFT_1143428 [Coniochaeta sp. 2T2.1]|nr:hypothetical protein GE09DRAFT_1143428 [Coniochaeta sp. 2T2.1]